MSSLFARNGSWARGKRIRFVLAPAHMKNTKIMKRILEAEGLTSVYLKDSSNMLSRLVLWTSKIIAD